MLDLDAIFDPEEPLPVWSMVRPAELPADWHFLWDERSAFMEYEGKLPRERAEAAALVEIIHMMGATQVEADAAADHGGFPAGTPATPTDGEVRCHDDP